MESQRVSWGFFSLIVLYHLTKPQCILAKAVPRSFSSRLLVRFVSITNELCGFVQ